MVDVVWMNKQHIWESQQSCADCREVKNDGKEGKDYIMDVKLTLAGIKWHQFRLICDRWYVFGTNLVEKLRAWWT